MRASWARLSDGRSSPGFRWAESMAMAALAALAVVLVVIRARRDSADPARCGALVAMGARCCAKGQWVDAGRCAGAPAECPEGMQITETGCVGRLQRVRLPSGTLKSGAGDWEAQGRITPHDAAISPFELDSLEITEDEYVRCVGDGACTKLPLRGEPGRPMTGLTRADAAKYCVFRGGRLPSEDEWTWAAGGALSRRYPWGDTGAVCRRVAWGLAGGPCGFGAEGPELAGSHRDGATPEG